MKSHILVIQAVCMNKPHMQHFFRGVILISRRNYIALRTLHKMDIGALFASNLNYCDECESSRIAPILQDLLKTFLMIVKC